MNWLVLLFSAIVLLLNILATIKIRNYRLFETKTRVIHYILIWCIPILWAILILIFPFDPPKKTGKFERHRYMDTGYPKGTGVR